MRISLFANLTTPLLLFVSSLYFVAYGFEDATLEDLKTTNNILTLFRSWPSDSTIKNIGDINGDGIDDLMISYACNTYEGIYIVFGNKNSDSSIDLENLVANGQGFTIYNDIYDNDGMFGYALSPAGDINDDGINDFIVGGFCEAYVFFGRNEGFTDINLSTMTQTQGFKIYSPSCSNTAIATVSNAGDFNNDGIDDIMIGITTESPLNRTNAGSVYILFGHPGTFSNVSLAEFTSGTQGLKIIGALSNDTLGSSVSSAGDFNADGIDDVILRLTSPLNYRCKFYVIYGHEGEFEDLDLATLTKDQGFQISAATNYQQFAYPWQWMTVNAGDFNGDGINDIAFAIQGYSSILYVVFGVSGGLTDFTLNDFPENQGFQVTSSSGHYPHFIAKSADMNADGMSDLIFGLSDSWQIVYGRKDRVTKINLENLTSADGFRINVTSNPPLIIDDWPGESIDFNNDGAVDLAMRTNISSFSVILDRNAKSKTNIIAIIVGGTVGPFVLVSVGLLIYFNRRKTLALQKVEAEKKKMECIPSPNQESPVKASGPASPTADNVEVPIRSAETSISYEIDSPQNKEEEQQQ